MCICVCRIRVRVRTCHPYYLTFFRHPCGTNPFYHLCMQVGTRHCLYAAHSAWSQRCVYTQRCAHSSRCMLSTYMCSAAVFMCVCVCRIRVRVRTCHPYYVTFLRHPCGTNPFYHLCMQVWVHGTAYTLRTQHGHRSVWIYSGVHTALAVCVVHTCVAQQYSRVFACVGYAYVFEPAMQPHLPPAFLRYLLLWRSCGANPFHHLCMHHLPCMYAFPAKAVHPVTSFRVFQHVASYTCIQRNPCAYYHHTIRPCSLNCAVRTTYEHPISDILRLKLKVVDLIVLHVTAGRALSVIDLQWQCSASEESPPLRLLMGNRARMGFDVFDARDKIKHLPNLEAHLLQDFFPHRRYLSLGVLKHSTAPDDREVPSRAASHQSSVTKHSSTYTKKH